MTVTELEPGFTEVAEGVIVRPMLTINDAIDLFLGDLARRGRADRTRDEYRRILDKFNDRFPRQWDAAKITTDDCERFLDLWARRSKGTQSQIYAPLNGLFRFLYRTRRIRQNPMEFVPAVTRQRPEDLDVVTVSALDVELLLAAARPWTEKTALNILAYMGPRRHATALLRLSDYDRRTVELRFREKGAKTIWKPVPDALAHVLDAAIAAGAISGGAPFQPADPYLVPPAGPLARNGVRDDRVIWRVVKAVAARAGVDAHVHALRGAFAVYYLEQNPGDIYGLQELLGHTSLEVTKVYLRRFDRTLAMQRVRSLVWGDNTTDPGSPQIAEITYAEPVGVGAGGFEPPSADTPLPDTAGTEHSADDDDPDDLDAALRARLRARPDVPQTTKGTEP